MRRWQYVTLVEDGKTGDVSVVGEERHKKIATALADKSWSKALSYMGKHGWEAFSVAHRIENHYENRYAYFKRPASSKTARKKRLSQPRP